MSDASNADSLATTTNRLSLAASILAAGAFLVAFLQALLQYSNSGTERDKCTECAINIASRLAYRRWSWREWKWRYYYPELDFRSDVVFDRILENMSLKIGASFLNTVARIPGNGFRSLQSHNVPTSEWIHDGLTVLCTQKKASDGDKRNNDSINKWSRVMTTKDLTWKQYLQWQWWLYKHPQQAMRRPRATWAQVIRALGFQSVSSLSLRSVDAGSIPAYIDVPIQRVKLFDIGILCFSMGFKHVKIDVDKREFTATGPFGSITTENIQNFGKVLRFEGDMFAIHQDISKGSATWFLSGAAQTNGKLNFGSIMAGPYVPMKLLVDSLIEGCDDFNKKMVDLLRTEDDSMILGHICHEATFFHDLVMESLKSQIEQSLSTDQSIDINQQITKLQENNPREYQDSIKLALANWQLSTHVCVPSIILTSSFASILSLCIAFPSAAVLDPLTHWLRGIADDLNPKHKPQNFTVSKSLQRLFANGAIDFVREDSRFTMFNGIQLQSAGYLSWGLPFVKDIFESLPDEIKAQIIIPDEGDEEAGNIRAVIMPQAVQLLNDFNPRKWATACEQLQIQNGVGIFYRPPNLLWTQVILLDISIRLLIRGSLSQLNAEPPSDDNHASRRSVDTDNMNRLIQEISGGGVWTKPELKVVRAIHESWILEPPITDTSTPPATDLDATTSETDGSNPLPPMPDASEEAVEVSAVDPPDGSTDTAADPADSSRHADENAILKHGVTGPEHTEDEPPPTPRLKRTLTAWSNILPPPQHADVNNPTPRQWDLTRALRKHSGLPTEGAKAELRIQRLGDLLKLRALFFLAFLMVSPNSTDVYLAEGCDVEMPMI